MKKSKYPHRNGHLMDALAGAAAIDRELMNVARWQGEMEEREVRARFRYALRRSLKVTEAIRAAMAWPDSHAPAAAADAPDSPASDPPSDPA